MKRILFSLVVALLPLHGAWAGIISAAEYANDAAFTVATGAVSLTGPLPNSGNVGTSEIVGDATLSAGNTIFVGTGWSTLLPNNRAIAISGPENLTIAINTGLASAFGFYFHEPIASTAQLDGCNTSAPCVQSTFLIEFLLSGGLVDSITFSPPDDVSIFFGIILDMPFDTVKFTETAGTEDNEFYGEMYIARVPEPATLALLGIALAGLGFARRRKLH